MPEPQALPSAPLSIGPFLVQEILDHGSQSCLYLARDQESQALVMLKTATPGTVTPGLSERYSRALEAARRLDHPGVLQAHELGRDPAFGPYLVLDYTEGVCLSSLLSKGIPAFSALHLLVQVVQVMDFAARQGIFHGDLKPGDIWVTARGEARLNGFGVLGSPAPGSAGHAAPERVNGGPPSARSDQFSLAATAFHLLAGQPPFRGATAEDVLRAVRLGELAFPSKMPQMMQKVFLKAMAPEPSGRYASLRDFLAVLIAAAPLEEHRLEDLLSFLDGTALAFEGMAFLRGAEAPVGETTAPDPTRKSQPMTLPAGQPLPAVEERGQLETRLLAGPGVCGFATFTADGALLASSPQAGELVDLAPSVYVSLADAASGAESGDKVRHLLFRTRGGLRYVLHRRERLLTVVKLKPEANLQEVLQVLDAPQGLN